MIRFSHEANSWQIRFVSIGDWHDITPRQARLFVDDGYDVII